MKMVPTRGGAALRLIAALLASVSAQALAPPALAQSPPDAHDSEQRLAYDIPAQPLSRALIDYARQSQLNALYAHDGLDGLAAPALRGAFTREEALAQLLSTSALEGRINPDRSFSVEEPRRPQGARAEGARSAPLTDPLTRVPDPASSAEDSAASDALVVTGTRIRGAAPAGANLVTIDRDDIDQSGRGTLQDVLRALPQVFPGSQNEVTQLNSTVGGSNIGFGASVDLRGLGADATLTLVNGRRLAPAGFGNFVDISAIPLAAVERVEVLADGASATYGSDAIGGVVNVILRRDFDGALTSLRVGGATQGGLAERALSHVAGWRTESGDLVLGYEYRMRERLAAEDRAFTASSDLRPVGGLDQSRNQSNPGNITRVGTTNVVFAIPRGQDGTALAQNQLLAGQINLQNLNQDIDVAPEQVRHSVFASFRQELGPIEIFADAFASEREAVTRETQLTANLTVPASNAYRQRNNLFPGQGNLTIGYSFANDLGPVRYSAEAQTVSLLSGLAFDLPSDWRFEATGTFARHQDHVRFDNGVDTVALTALLASSSPATAFNPFSDGGNSPASVLAAFNEHTASDTRSDLTAFAIKADGPLFTLPAGTVRMAIGAERRRDRFRIERTRFNAAGIGAPILPTQAPGERATEAVFFEAFIPLLADLPLIQSFALSLSARREASVAYEAATTPKIGLHWAVSGDLTLRATWGTSFKAPRFDQLYQTTTAAYALATPAQDPFATNGSTGALLLGGGNANLEPEDAESWTAGFDYEPTWFGGFKVGASYFDIDFANRIGAAGDVLTAIRNPASFAQVLIRNPSQAEIDRFRTYASTINGALPADGVELIFDGRLVNIASQRIRGIDLSLGYTLATQIGDIALTLGASNLLQFSRTPVPGAAPIDQLDRLYNPVDWRARAGVAWSTEAWRAGLTAHYAGDYADTISTPTRSVRSWTTYDLQVARTFTNAAIDDGPRTELVLNLQNLLDEDPPFVNNTIGLGFDAVNASPVGRLVSLELRRRW